MAHFAELDENNIVLRVLVTDNDDPNGDEGYQWLVNTFGGRWMKTSYNTLEGQHLRGGTPFRGTYAGVGFIYDEVLDKFLPPKQHKAWVFDETTYQWVPPIPKPDGGFWKWSDETDDWQEVDNPFE